jgi:hypothetical protein
MRRLRFAALILALALALARSLRSVTADGNRLRGRRRARHARCCRCGRHRQPDAIVNLLTASPRTMNPRPFAAEMDGEAVSRNQRNPEVPRRVDQHETRTTTRQLRGLHPRGLPTSRSDTFPAP